MIIDQRHQLESSNTALCFNKIPNSVTCYYGRFRVLNFRLPELHVSAMQSSDSSVVAMKSVITVQLSEY